MPRPRLTREIVRDNGPYVPDGRVGPLYGGRWGNAPGGRPGRKELLPQPAPGSIAASATSVVVQDSVVLLDVGRR